MIFYKYENGMNYTAIWTTEKREGVLADLVLDTEQKTIMALNEYGEDDDEDDYIEEDYIDLDLTEKEYNEILNEAIQFL